MPADIFVGSVSVGVVPDARGWNRRLQAELVPGSDSVGKEYGQRLSKGIVNEMGRQSPEMAKQGAKSGGAFAEGFKKRLEASLKTLPKIELDADASPADRKLQEIRARMEELSRKQIGVDISSKDAMAELALIDGEL